MTTVPLKRNASHLDCEEVCRSSLEEFDLASEAKEPKSCFCWLFTETDRSGGSGLVRVPVGDGSDEEESPPTRKKVRRNIRTVNCQFFC
jgi:hypothetical protein